MRADKHTPSPNPFGGVWRSHYKYHSSGRKGEFENEHLVRIYQTGRFLIVETIPGVNASYVIIRLSLDDGIATGTWQEETNPDGYYKGAVYHGAIQLVVDKDNKTMAGKWVGFDKESNVNTGPWELTYIGPELPAEYGRE